MSKELLQMVFDAMSYGNAQDRESARLAVGAALAEQPAQQEPESECNPQDLCAGCRCKYAAQPAQQETWQDLHNALQRIDTAATGLPTFEVRHEGGIDAFTQNIVDAIVALHKQPAQQGQAIDVAFFRQVLSVAIAGLYEHYKDDVLRVFSLDELQAVVDLSESLQPKLVEDIYKQAWIMLAATPQPAQRKPLTDEEILEILCIYLDEDDDIEEWRHEINEARAIEAAHGIKENT